MKIPKIIVFDLDACLWSPEMYQLWGGGSPFRYDGKYCYDCKGQKVKLLGYVTEFLTSFLKNQEFQNTQLAIASKCDEPDWAREILNLFQINGKPLGSLFTFIEIYKDTKQTHLKNIQKKSGAQFNEMVFFDDQMDNIKDVQKLGVISILTPNGFLEENWLQSLKQYNLK